MALNFSRVIAVLRREAQEIVKSRGLMLTVFLPPILLTLIPLIAIAVVGRAIEAEGGGGAGDVSDLGPMIRQMPELATWSVGDVTMFVVLNQFLIFFLMMPLIVSMSIAAQSIVGEKQSKSLEPLLATPIKTGELLFAKALGAMLPAVLATWAAFVIFVVAGRFLITSNNVYSAILNPKWLVAMLILAPLLALLAVSVTVIISSRVNDTRTVQQIGGFLVMPIVVLGVAQTAGLVLVNAFTFIIGAAIVAAIDALILRIGVSLFQREKILTQWK